VTIATKGVIELGGSLGGSAKLTLWESSQVYRWIDADVYRKSTVDGQR
jgi:hypothetical protein